jgi:hypothetical protein
MFMVLSRICWTQYKVYSRQRGVTAVGASLQSRHAAFGNTLLCPCLRFATKLICPRCLRYGKALLCPCYKAILFFVLDSVSPLSLICPQLRFDTALLCSCHRPGITVLGFASGMALHLFSFVSGLLLSLFALA